MNKTRDSISPLSPSHTDTEVKSCATCKHDPIVKRSVDDAPPICWNCINTAIVLEFPLPMWTPKI